MMRFRIRQMLLVWWMLLASVAFAQPQPTHDQAGPGPVKAPHLTLEMVSAGPAIARGGTQTLGFVFSMESGWHVYWRNAGYAGFPPKVKWALPDGVSAGPLQFPAPDRLPLEQTVDYGYEDSTAYPVTVTAEPNAKADSTGNVRLKASLNWLVCKETCVPGKADLQMDLKLVPAWTAVSHEGERVGALGLALSHMPKPVPANSSFTAQSHGTDLVLTATLGSVPKDAEFYPIEPDQIADSSEQPIDLLDNGVRIRMQRPPDAKAPLKELHGLLKISNEDSYDVRVPVVAVAALPTEPKPGGAATSVTAASAVSLAFIGGVLLNLMPCVFPVLFLKALSLLQTSSEERSRLRTHGLAYTAGIVASFWLVVAVLLVLRAGGKQFGWGFQLQSPGFVAVLALFLFFFALSLAGVFDFGLTFTSAGGSLAQKGGYSGSFFTGVLATVVATPCVGPFMGAAIGFALAQPAWVTFLVFTSLAFGLAAPYLLLSLQPAWVKLLPRPGAWMELLKQITALPLFATVIWLLYVYGRLFGGGSDAAEGITRMAWLLAGLMLIAVAAWALGRWPARRGSTITALVLSACAVGLPAWATHSNASEAAWQTFSADAVKQARSQGKAVFVDFTAAWCLSCQVNERVVLKSADVQRELKSGNVIPMRADWTQYDDKITAALQSLGRNGVPTYVIYPANATAAPDVLPEVLSKGVVLDAMKRDLAH